MLNFVDITGVHIESYGTTVLNMINGTLEVPGLVQIYGSDIVTDSDTPDGQFINIIALAKQDVLNLCVSIYDSFDPDQAVGVSLDAIAQYCGLTRKGGTSTKVVIAVTADRSVTLTGLDGIEGTTPFSVSDSNGNTFNLITGVTVSAGSTSLNFQAEDIGYIQVLPNTITTVATPTLGITAVNNAAVPYQLGANQETDAQFRLRRQSSLSIPSSGFAESLKGALMDVTNVIDAQVFENYGTSADAIGTPAKSIWVTVNGGTDSDIADMIYLYRSMGCAMYGTTDVNITPTFGSTFVVSFDRATSQPLFIQFGLSSSIGGSIDSDSVKTYLASNYTFGIYEAADISSVTEIIKSFDPTLVVTSCKVSVVGTTSLQDLVYPTEPTRYFTLSTSGITVL